jgi:hypothetical protein
MHLKEKLNEFLFNLETANLLQSLGRTNEQIKNEMTNLNFSDSLLQFQTSSQHLYNSVMLRLRLYSENNFTESQVRQSLSILNNLYVNALLEYLYTSNTSNIVETVSTPVVSTPVVETVSTPVVSTPVVETVSTNAISNEDSEEDENLFESFFDSCVEKTDEATDILKASDFYQAFSEWWQGQYEDNVPDKKELKNYLNEKLGKSKKSTWTNVVLND